MSEGSKSRGPWVALAGLIPHDLREMVGVFLVVFIFMGGIITLGKLPRYFDSLADSPAKQYCWALKDIRGVLIKFNQCTGETVEINIETPPAQSFQSAPTAPSVPSEPRKTGK